MKKGGTKKEKEKKNRREKKKKGRRKIKVKHSFHQHAFKRLKLSLKV